MPLSAVERVPDAWSRTDLELELARCVVLVGRRWRARLDERLRAVRQTSARYATLWWVTDSPEGLNQTELAEKVGIETPTLVRLLDQLEAQGLVTRTPSPSDRRAKIVTATAKAADALAEGDRISANMRQRLFASSRDDELSACLKVLDRLRVQLERF